MRSYFGRLDWIACHALKCSAKLGRRRYWSNILFANQRKTKPSFDDFSIIINPGNRFWQTQAFLSSKRHDTLNPRGYRFVFQPRKEWQIVILKKKKRGAQDPCEANLETERIIKGFIIRNIQIGFTIIITIILGLIYHRVLEHLPLDSRGLVHWPLRSS